MTQSLTDEDGVDGPFERAMASGLSQRSMTERQRKVLELMVAFEREHGTTITIRTIRDRLGISSTNGVADHLTRLARHGFVKRDPRGWKVTPAGYAALEVGAVPLPAAQLSTVLLTRTEVDDIYSLVGMAEDEILWAKSSLHSHLRLARVVGVVELVKRIRSMLYRIREESGGLR